MSIVSRQRNSDPNVNAKPGEYLYIRGVGKAVLNKSQDTWL